MRPICPLDADDFRAVIGQHHPRERAGANAGKLDNAQAGEWRGGNWVHAVVLR